MVSAESQPFEGKGYRDKQQMGEDDTIIQTPTPIKHLTSKIFKISKNKWVIYLIIYFFFRINLSSCYSKVSFAARLPNFFGPVMDLI